jgi:tetratricopeptide (TPR) repeat protein
MKKIIHLSFIMFILGNICNAQVNCNDAFFKAKELYNAGKIQEAINTLEPCISSLKSKDYQFEGFKLLAIANHDLGNLEARNKYINKILALRPHYQKYPNNDPSSFTKELTKFQVVPQWEMGLSVGTSINNSRLSKSYTGLNELQKYNPSIGYQFGVIALRSLKNKLKLKGNLSIGGTSIVHEIESKNNWTKTYKENMGFYNISIGLNKYYKINKKLEGFTGIEIGTMYLYKANVSVTSINFSPESSKIDTKNAIEERNKIQPHFGILSGVSYNLERGKIDFEMGYNFFTNTTVINSKRMNDTNFIFDSQYINDDIKLGLFTFNFTYSLPLKYRISNK